jgi:hypothetical protein
MKIAILGFGPSQSKAPWEDKSWEKWGLPWCQRWEEYTRLFEMHSQVLLNLQNAFILKEFWDGEKIYSTKNRSTDYGSRLLGLAKDPSKKLYMQEPLEGVDVYPYDEIIPMVGDYFTSSISYMVALAILEIKKKGDPENTIGIWGVDLKDDQEWFYQRPNLEYLVGFAKGMGIKTMIPDESRLFGFPEHAISFGGIMVTYSKRYGMLGDQPQEFQRRAMPPQLYNGDMEKYFKSEKEIGDG